MAEGLIATERLKARNFNFASDQAELVAEGLIATERLKVLLCRLPVHLFDVAEGLIATERLKA